MTPEQLAKACHNLKKENNLDGVIAITFKDGELTVMTDDSQIREKDILFQKIQHVCKTIGILDKENIIPLKR